MFGGSAKHVSYIGSPPLAKGRGSYFMGDLAAGKCTLQLGYIPITAIFRGNNVTYNVPRSLLMFFTPLLGGAGQALIISPNIVIAQNYHILGVSQEQQEQQ